MADELRTIQRYEPEGFTDRGFRVFAHRQRPEDEVLYGQDAAVRVVESSIATRGPHVHIFEGGESVHLNLGEARMVIAALMLFVEEAEADLLTESAS